VSTTAGYEGKRVAESGLLLAGDEGMVIRVSEEC
jgi:hypothetical protein